MTATPNPDAKDVLALLPKAPPLGEPLGKVVRVASSDQLVAALAAAETGVTILVSDGHYAMDRAEIANVDGVTIRSESGDRDRVVLDGECKFTCMMIVGGCKDLTIADMTMTNCKRYGIFMLGDSDCQRLRVYNMKFHNIWVRAVKGTHPARIGDDGNNRQSHELQMKVRPVGGSIRYCLFVNDDEKPFDDDTFDGDYVSGIDMMMLKDWTIADNAFVGIRGKHGGGRGAIFVWIESENVVTERNIFINCDRSICYGNHSNGPLHMTGGIVRNNFVVAGKWWGIEVCRTVDCKVYNNTVYATQNKTPAVEFYHCSTGDECYNNLIRGKLELDHEVAHGQNLLGELEGYFVNPAAGDLRLTEAATGAIGRGKALADVAEDFFGRKRHVPPDIGGHEFRP
jgi:hypothetical protein